MKNKALAITSAVAVIAIAVSAYLGVNLYQANKEIEANKYHFTLNCEYDREGQNGFFLYTCEEVYETEINDIYKNCLEKEDAKACVEHEMGWE